jgi:hypothetical protein
MTAVRLHMTVILLRMSSFILCWMPRQPLLPAPPVTLLLALRQPLLVWHGTPACAASSVHADTQASSTCRQQSWNLTSKYQTMWCGTLQNVTEDTMGEVLVHLNVC